MTALRLALGGALALASLLPAAHAAAAGDPVRGEALYARCAGCHALAADRTGPRHCGLLGRKAGSVPGFPYSPAMAKADLAWNDDTLERFLRNPAATVPGTSMTYAGVPDAQERRDLVAYLRRAGSGPECRR